jgi:hypothetical protein
MTRIPKRPTVLFKNFSHPITLNNLIVLLPCFLNTDKNTFQYFIFLQKPITSKDNFAPEHSKHNSSVSTLGKTFPLDSGAISSPHQHILSIQSNITKWFDLIPFSFPSLCFRNSCGSVLYYHKLFINNNQDLSHKIHQISLAFMHYNQNHRLFASHLVWHLVTIISSDIH